MMALNLGSSCARGEAATEEKMRQTRQRRQSRDRHREGDMLSDYLR